MYCMCVIFVTILVILWTTLCIWKSKMVNLMKELFLFPFHVAKYRSLPKTEKGSLGSSNLNLWNNWKTQIPILLHIVVKFVKPKILKFVIHIFVIIFLSSYNMNSKNFQILLPMMKKTNTDVYSHSFIAKNKSQLQI